MKLMTTTQVWEGFDATKLEINDVLINSKNNILEYTYLAKKADDGDVIIDMQVFSPDFDCKKVVLIVGSYNRPTQMDIINDLVKKGYVVCVPDYSGIYENTHTKYPDSLNYGYYKNASKHMTSACETPLETTQYLYAVVIRRAITFINQKLKKDNIVIMGFNEGVEIAMQVAGEEQRINGLVCINGASYYEYVKYNKYGDKEMEMDDNMLSWITGVSSTSYAKKIKVPVMFAVGSNGTLSDIDRLPNIFNIIPHNKIRAIICPKYINNIDYKAYNSVLDFIKDCFLGSMPPEMPNINIDFNEDGTIYVNVEVDNSIKIEKVKVFYSYGELNHTIRHWHEAVGELAGVKEYIAKLDIKASNVPVFAFAEVLYKNGLVSTSLPYYRKLETKENNAKSIINSPIVYQYSSKEKVFTEVSFDAVILKGSVEEATLPIGLKGVCCRNGSLVSFAIGEKNKIDKDKILQIDCYSRDNETLLSITAIADNCEYTAEIKLECEDTFESLQFKCGDFKNTQFKPLDRWESMKGIRINNNNIVIGKIMFI